MNPAEERTLLELFADIHAVFEEGDAFTSDQTRQISLGRCYRAWKRTRDVLARQSFIPLKQRTPSEATGTTQPEREEAVEGERHTRTPQRMRSHEIT